jgi:hypothetical protein
MEVKSVSKPVRFTLGESPRITHRKEGWVGPTAGFLAPVGN